MVAPVSEMPVGAVVVNVPPHTVALALATVNPVGSVSVNATPVKDAGLPVGFVSVNVSEVVAFSAIVDGVKDFPIVGGASTETLAEAVPPVPPSVEAMLPVVLLCKPAEIPVTFTEKEHELLAATVAPDKLTVAVPAVAVIVPEPHEPVRPFGVATFNPEGNESVNATPVRLVAVLLF
jgi:hypothetical protein